MNWFLSRLVVLCLGGMLGVVVGAWTGGLLHGPEVGMAAGAAFGASGSCASAWTDDVETTSARRSEWGRMFVGLSRAENTVP